MSPVFLDLHIHTSENPDDLNSEYDLDKLIEKVNEVSEGAPYLISLTDHNTINKPVYLECLRRQLPVILGVELHIEYSPHRDPYHCHIYFNPPLIHGSVIDALNEKLDRLYPSKTIRHGSRVPGLEAIVTEFDSFDFLLLPHGGQSHHTFDKAIPAGARFDTTLERTIYYNQFDGFTARSNKGLEETQHYFKRLGISDFVNLVTCSDNYVPAVYPNAKDKDASPFVPTWMLAQPCFAGLRLSLSESSRLVYGEKPTSWSEHIGTVRLHNDLIDIEVELSPGLNVVIGGSSTGKTLFVDTVHRSVAGLLAESRYSGFGVSDVAVSNPSGMTPHYVEQNYIVQLVNGMGDSSINDIDMIKAVFPNDQEVMEALHSKLSELKKDLRALVSAIERFEEAYNGLGRIPIIQRLVFEGERAVNLPSAFAPTTAEQESLEYPENEHERHLAELSSIERFVQRNAFANHDASVFNSIRQELDMARHGAKLHDEIQSIVTRYTAAADAALENADNERQRKTKNYESLLKLVGDYSGALSDFDRAVQRLSSYSISVESKQIEVEGHKLSIENHLKINKQSLRDVLNKHLKTDSRIENIRELDPSDLFEAKFSKKSPKVADYQDFADRVYREFEQANKTTYRIETSEGADFDELSAGWKTSILLDLIIGYKGDLAPLIVDQPEDNLATSYINSGLLQSIKKVKDRKQVILVSHNATIPMLGDAQTVVVCKNDNGKIRIRSNPLEGELEGQSIVDLIARITDGGKPSIKKRVKKYNLKSFRGEDETEN